MTGHFAHIEVTVAAAIVDEDGHIFGDNMVDTTLSFAARAADPPADVDDALINAMLAHNISPVLAAIQIAVTSMGYVFAGIIDEPMNDSSHVVGQGHSSPVTVRFDSGPEPTGRPS